MKYRPFGRTGWEISEIGFGAWQIGGGWGKVDDGPSINTLLYAFERGEPPRVCRRLQLLRDWSHDESHQDPTFFTRGA